MPFSIGPESALDLFGVVDEFSLNFTCFYFIYWYNFKKHFESFLSTEKNTKKSFGEMVFFGVFALKRPYFRSIFLLRIYEGITFHRFALF